MKCYVRRSHSRRETLLAVIVAGAALVCSTSAAGAAPKTRIIESASDHVTIEVLIPPPRLETVEAAGERFTRVAIDGAAEWHEPGAPGVLRLPVLVGVPSGVRPTARVLEAKTEVLTDILLYPTPAETIVAQGGLPAAVEVFRWDRAAYEREGLFPAEAARVTSVSRMRFQEIATVEVYPVRARPVQHEAEIASRLVVEVRWDGAGKSGGAAEEPAPPDERWESVYRGLLANPDQARPLRSRPARTAAPPDGGPRKSGARAGTSPEWKLSVLETGLYRLTFESLAAKGFPSGIPVGEIRVFQRSVSDTLLWAEVDPFLAVELPLDVIDSGSDGAFGPGDAVHVYLRDFRSQFMPGDYEDMFTTRAVYWLTFTPGETGARMSERPGWLGFNGLTPPTSFLSPIHFEPEAFWNAASPSELYDLWYAVNFTAPTASFGIEFTDVDPSGQFRFRARALARIVTNGTNPARLRFSANGTPFGFFQFAGLVRATYTPDSTFSASLLSNGTNTILYSGSIGDDPTAGSGAYLDWLEFDYPRFYRARNSRLAFTSGDVSGQSQFDVSGFGSGDVRLYDVTEPYAPIRIAVDSLDSSGGETVIHFQADVDTLRRYEAATPGGARTLPDSLVVADTPGSLAGDEADHVMIIYDDFEGGLAPLVAHRQAQGLEVRVARISDVYDEFNGGMPHPAAIRRYMKYALTHWSMPPTYLLLVGDASEDHARRLARDDIDYVPSLPVYGTPFADIGDYWDASDNWYVLLDGPTLADAADDNFFDVLVGRFSVGSPEELSVQVSKTLVYESGDFAEPWRSRYILVADDEWITRNDQCAYYDANQSGFRTTSEAHTALMDTATTNIALHPLLMRLSDLTDRLHAPCDDDTSSPSCMPLVGFNRTGNICVIDSVRERFTSVLFDSINDGALFVSYQGHGNRWVLSHESVILDGFNHIPSGYFASDIPRFAATNRPCIFMAYGCSISEFEKLNPNGTIDDCLTEKMMNVSQGGAVGVIGSAGIEFLEPNLILNTRILEALLAGGEGNPPRFILGEINAIGMGQYGSVFGYHESMLRYILFGDPALQIRALPASFSVRVDGEEVSDGHFLAGHIDGSPVRITVASTDSTVLAGLTLTRSDQGDVSPDTVFADSVVFLHTVEFAQYDLILQAPAVGGGTHTVVLKVDVQATITFDGIEIIDGDLVDPGSEIVVFLTAPVPVAPSDITVRLDGAVVAATPDSVGPRSWEIVLPSVSLATGEHTVEVSVLSLSKTKRFSVKNDFQVLQPLNFPNPLRGDETTCFSFTLTADVNYVDIAIYTVNGRKIWERNRLSANVGYNPPGPCSLYPDFVWDGRDADGDDIANGVYLYRVRAVSTGGQSAEAVGKLAILRGQQ